MSQTRTTVIAKTDIVGYTPRVLRLGEKELQTLLINHKRSYELLAGD